jgi:sec-independent protein translocase protein TatB
MFDIGFSELIVIGLVALVVVGPERLPKVARTVGLFLGRMQRYVYDVKTEINREIQLDELKKLQSEFSTTAHALESSVRQEIESAQSVFSDLAHEARSTRDDLKTTAENTENAPPEEVPVESPALSSPTPKPAPPDPHAPAA